MSKIILDISGRGGLLERYQGDLNDTSSSPHLRYLGGDDQFADGLWNPLAYYGYCSPPNNSFTSITGTIGAEIVSFVYDDPNDELYAAQKNNTILSFSDLEDTSAASYKTVSAGIIQDMELYEVNGQKSLVYAIDSGVSINDGGDGLKLAFNALETSGFDPVYDNFVRQVASGNLVFAELVDAASDASGVGALSDKRRWAQSFNTSEITAEDAVISGVKAVLSREAGTGLGITIQVSVQANAAKTDVKFTDRGAWSSGSVSYAVNDVVTQGGNDYLCRIAHSSSASDEPGTAGGFDFWDEFGEPSGTALASGTFTLDELSDLETSSDNQFEILFSSTVNLSANTLYWIVIEESGSNMTASDKLGWLHSVNNNGTNSYRGKGYYTNNDVWIETRSNFADEDCFDLSIIVTETENLSNSFANGSFNQETGADTFLHLADNGLLYWFADNRVHSLDGSITGGVTGTVNEAILVFPSYTSIPDVAETRGRMYIAVQTSARTNAVDDSFFRATRSGVFVWDRRSQLVGGSDFFPTPGAREIKNLFTSSTGDIIAITVNNSGFTELRALSGNQFGVIQTMEKGAYPESRRGISQVGNFSIWLGRNGVFYAYGAVAPGEALRLYRIATAAGLTNYSYPGAIFVGNKDGSNNELAVYFGWSDTGPGHNISKWYTNGEGTIDSVVQLAGQGDVYTKVQQLPGLSTVRYIRGFHMPAGSDGDATVAATLKCYLNQSTTPAWTRDITYDDLARGWFEKEYNKPNVNFLQFEIEWSSLAIGTNTYRPMYLEIELGDEGRINS